MPLAQQVIASGHAFKLSTTGTSMRPMLYQGDSTVEIVAAPEKLRKYDLPLYRRDNGQYVLHRVVGVGETYTCVGDNQFELEHGIRHDQIIGVVKSFTRKGKHWDTAELGYRVYCRFWHYTRLPRRLLRGAAYRLRKFPKK